MKKTFLFLLILGSIPNFSKASDFRGGEIWYDFVGDSLNPYKYRIWLQLYRDTGTAPAPANPMLCITSSCFGDTSVSLIKQPFQLQPGSDSTHGSAGSVILPFVNECVNGFTITELHRYSLEIDLPGACSDFRFSYTGSARAANDNLASQGENFYIKARLNSTLGPNSSARFITPALRSFCLGKKVTWSQAIYDPDGDSLHVSLWDVFSKSSSCDSNEYKLNFKPGFFTYDPFSTLNGMYADTSRSAKLYQFGTFLFTPVQPGKFIVKMRALELRIQFSNFWVVVGTSEREILINVSDNCSINSSSTNFYSPDTTNATSTIFNCGDSILNITASSRILCSSIASDGSDFRLFNSQGDTIPVVAAGTGPCTDLFTKELWIKLGDSLDYNDSLQLVIQSGTDSNTLQNVCGYQLPPDDSTEIYVLDCNTWVNRPEYDIPGIVIYPNPADDYLKVEIAEPSSGGKLWITDLSGRILQRQKEIDRDNAFNLKQLPAGVYLLHYSPEAGPSRTVKFLID